MTIHKEGRQLLVWVLFFFIGLNGVCSYFISSWIILGLIGTGSFVIFLFVLQFFRHPAIKIDYDKNKILAPADGKIVVIEETEETEYVTKKRIQVSIFMSPFNVHVNRIPVGGKISYYAHHEGKYLVAWHPKSSMLNEHTTLIVTLDNGYEIRLRQIAGAVARRIKCYVTEGQRVRQGEEFGFIKFGSRVDLFLPCSTQIDVKIGQKVLAGRTVIGRFS